MSSLEKEKKKERAWRGLAYRYRYVFVALIFLFCVGFEISGSSIGMWQEYMGETVSANGNLLGTSRGIRSDEWAVNTPMAFSQYYNHSGSFPYFSDTLRGSSTDAYIVYGQPVAGWEVVFRPFQWGYLFLSPGKGLSFFWCGRFLALLMLSFEFGMYLFRKRKSYAVAYSAALTLSPMIQWWFAINGLVEMLIFGQAAILLIAAYLREERYRKKILLMLGLVVCGGGYILVFYPSWQIPLGYVFLSLLIGVACREYSRERWSFWKDSLLVLLFLLLLGGSMAWILGKSWNTIQAVMNTVYPGKRSFSGGGALEQLINWGDNILFPFTGEVFSNTNVCEEAGLLSFFPMGILVGGIVWLKEKKKDPMLLALFFGTVFVTCYCVLPWPQVLAKVTLLSHCQPQRAVLGAELLNLLLLLYACMISEKTQSRLLGAVLSFGMSLLCSKYLFGRRPELFQGAFRIVPMIFVFLIGFYAAYQLRGKKSGRSFAVFCLVVGAISGMTVNPLHRGVDEIYGSSLMTAVREETESDQGSGLWIVENMGLPMNNMTIMAGAPTINSTNTYPDLERWELIDEKHAAEEIYNRYAHITFTLAEDEPANFELTGADQFHVTVGPEDLKTLQVRHILTNRELPEMRSEEVKLVNVNQVGSYYIYRVEYE